jgi:hypothetical protein
VREAKERADRSSICTKTRCTSTKAQLLAQKALQPLTLRVREVEERADLKGEGGGGEGEELTLRVREVEERARADRDAETLRVREVGERARSGP